MQGSQAQGTKAVEVGHAKKGPSFWHVAWWSIVLGLGMEALLLLIRSNQLTNLQPIAEACGKVTWALLVCLGLALGRVLSSEKPFWVGLTGLTTAPVAFTAAQGIQKTVGQLLSASGAVGGASITLAAVRGVEYMCLGTALAVISKRTEGGPRPHFLAGQINGLVFGGLVLLLTPATKTSVVSMLSWGVNEVVFPVGCAMVLYVGVTLSERVQAKPAG